MRLIVGALLLLAPAAAADADGLEPLLQQANASHWQKRWAAVERLSRLATADDETVFRLRGLMLRDARPRVREALAWACRLEPALGQSTLLGIILKKDRNAAVRRAAAGALLHYRDRRAIAALIEALGRETDPRTRLHIAESLRALTPAPCLLDVDPWRAWWAEHDRDPDFRPADEEPRRGEYEGIVLETRTVAPVPRKGGRRRPAPHVLVLPQFGWSTAAFGPYLLPLREHAAITWVRLPSVQTLTGNSGYGSDIPTYPVGRLVRALERFRAAHKVEHFVILAHGASGWIAMRYAITYRDRCAGLILIDTALDKEGYSRILHYAAARGTQAERFVAKTLTHQNNVPFNEATLHRIHALGLARGFHDPADLEIAWLFWRAREPQGFATVPEIKWRRHKEVAIPSLFFYSAASAFSGHRDADRIQRHFTRSIVAPVSQARGMPFVEENPKFHEVIQAFLARFDLIG
ncbi:MAG: alpha/beta fold hydrolase [Planctomycetota bacterium]|jgi:pimeloyl-ACP methyl ester carboxylesterase